ncbi:hypothetical protein C1I97_25170 [Streptomyces sp. NTH33]|uniref:hypothetical protein n=1 Tax=Streptomyces sp. NTH33 TaxID=1735453 RepID=UPI000DA9C9D9|nr:hypothetical protein [Streptomyces sp. NTH33]PZG97829.1 hypothetical protein C1I97_25170 [Streptomyces sp. NTH33]
MTAVEWLIALALAAGAWWVVQGITDKRAAAAPPGRIRPSVPPPLPTYVRADLHRARTTRAARAGGRHHRPEESS